MKKLLQINTVINSSATGRIAKDIGDLALKKGWESYIVYGRKNGSSNSKLIKIGSHSSTLLHIAKTRILDQHGLGSTNHTKTLIQQIKSIQPDIVHLHNLHGYYINYKLLFNFLKTTDIPIVWTLHDCWAFTGHCTQFEFNDCEKWKTECSNCPRKNFYPSSLLLDNSTSNHRLKKKLFGDIKNMTLVPVSNWLENLLKKSFISHHDASVIQNGIDTEVFKPSLQKNKTRRQYGLNDEFIILGVANNWNGHKGLSDLKVLSKHLDENDKIILIGLNKKQLEKLPDNILGIKRTDSIEELAALYTIANVFINPTYEDTFPTTNLEAMACGTPVLTYRTGGAVEQVDQETGFIIEQGDILASLEVFKLLKSSTQNDYEEKCVDRVAKHFEKNIQFKKYIELYDSILT